MRYFFTLVTIMLGWLMLGLLLSRVDSRDHFFVYLLAMINTVVLFIIGFRKK